MGAMFISGDEVSRRLAERATQVFKIDGSGNVIFEKGFDTLQDFYTIGIVVLAHYIRFVSGNVEAETISNHEVSQRSGIDVNVVNARLAQVKKERFVASPSRGQWRFVPANAGKFLDGVISDAKKSSED